MDGIKPRRQKRLTLPSRRSSTLPTPSVPAQTATDFALPPPKRRGWFKFWLITGLVLGISALGALCAWLWYQDALQPRAANGTAVAITIQEGAGIEEIAKELEQKSIIKNAFAFGIYTKLTNKVSIKTGTYLLAPSQPVSEIVDWLNQGKISTRKVTVLPGKTVKQIRDALVADGFEAQAVDAALQKTYDHPLFADKPAQASLEGYIFPETYFVTADSSPEELLVRSFDEFEKHLEASSLKAKLAARGFSLYQGITLASIVGLEVAKDADQQQVAQVFETRLARGMMLGSDPTYKYAASLLGVAPSVNIDSPYNTRIHSGLPPGPIANFNLSALKAVAEPAAGDYLYFVSGDDGVTHFSHTFEEHQNNIARFCKTLCAQP